VYFELLVFSGIQMNPVTEEERVSARVNALTEISARTWVDFWTDTRRCRTLVLLQDRANQISQFADSCRSILAMIYNTLFPRNAQPQGVLELMKAFKSAEKVQEFIKIQLIAGAKFALAWLRVHKPRLDLEVMSQGLPSNNKKKGHSMNRQYDAAHEPATRMIERLLEVDDGYFTEFHCIDP
jgi:hypothetical protein